jgi:hypothetical protein
MTLPVGSDPISDTDASFLGAAATAMLAPGASPDQEVWTP